MRYSLHLTNNCNLRCTYCYEDGKEDKNYKHFVISPEEADRRLQSIIADGQCAELELLGGEIFLYPEIVKYIFVNYHKYFSWLITTNGTVRNAEIDGLIAQYKPFIGVSLDDPQTINLQRIGIDFDRVLANAKYWRTLTTVGIAAVITPLNIHRLKETFDFYILEHNFRIIHFGCVEEWMNDYYWEVYKQETARLIENTEPAILREVHISPWKQHSVSKKEFIYEDGIEKVEIFNPAKMDLSAYNEAKYAGYCLYCKKIGVEPLPPIPAGVELVTQK